MLIRLLIFSTLVLAVNLVAGIFAKEKISRDFSLKNQHQEFIINDEGKRPKFSTLLRGTDRHTDPHERQRDSTNLRRKPKITKRFAKEEWNAEVYGRNNLTRLAFRRRSLLRDEVQRTDPHTSISNMRRTRPKPVQRNREVLQAEESSHWLATVTASPATGTDPSSTPVKGNSSEELVVENNAVTVNNTNLEVGEKIENGTLTENGAGSDKDVRNEHTGTSESLLRTNTTKTLEISESQPTSTSHRKRRPSAVIRADTPASPLPVAAALTMSESLYNHFRPLDKEVPEDHLLPFLNFGKKLVAVNAKATSPVDTSSSTSSTNSIEAFSTSTQTPTLGQNNLLSTKPQKFTSSITRVMQIPREDEIHEDMDVSVVKAVVEKNKASRGRSSSLQFLINLGGLYRKHEASALDAVPNISSVSVTPTPSSENNGMKTEQVTLNLSEFNGSRNVDLEALQNISTNRVGENFSNSDGGPRHAESPSHATTETSTISSITNYTDLSSFRQIAENATNRGLNPSSQTSDISKSLTASSDSLSAVPTQLPASSTRTEAIVSIPYERGRSSVMLRNMTTLAIPIRRQPSPYIHLHRHSNALFKLSKPFANISTASENFSVFNDNKISPQRHTNLDIIPFTSNLGEKPAATTSLAPLQTQTENADSHTGREELINVPTPQVNVSKLMADVEKVISDPRQRNAEWKLSSKTNESSIGQNVRNVGSDISSQASVESVTGTLITNTSPQSSHTLPTEIPFITSSIQSPTTKILSTAVVTSVSVKGAWPVMITEPPPLTPTLVPPQSYGLQKTKKEHLEHVLESPGRYDMNRSHSVIKEQTTNQTHHVTYFALTSPPPSLSSAAVINTTSGGQETSTKLQPEGYAVSNNSEVTITLKDITSNNTRNVTGTSTEYEQNNATDNSAKETRANDASKLGVSNREKEIGSASGGVMTRRGHGHTSRVGTPKPVTTNTTTHNYMNPDPPTLVPETFPTQNVTQTFPVPVTRQADKHSTSAPVTIKPPESDVTFDFPLFKLYNTSAVWAVPERGRTEEPRKYASTGNGSTTVKSTAGVMEASTHIAIVATKGTQTGNDTGSVYKGESRNETVGQVGNGENRQNTGGDVLNTSKSGVNLLLGEGKGVSRNVTVGSHRPVESGAKTQGVSVAVYIVSALGIVPVAIGVAFIARYCVRRRRKLLDDTDNCSDVSSRRGCRSGGGHTGSDVGSPVSCTKLPRVPNHMSWDQDKAAVQVSTAGWEFPRSKLRLQTVLGQGNFGQVLKAEADDIRGHEGTTRLVAVKTVKDGASSREKQDLLRELEIMQQLGSHANVVTLLGCCTEKEPYLLIMEYVMYGKLLAFLRDHRTRQHYYNFSEDSDALTSRDLTIFAYCVARGMEYLGSKGIIHRDLAARNVLVDHNKMCKIADFGMSRSVRETGDTYEQRHTKGALPIRWMAPESLHYRIFTHKSDVWSFGILMWEVVTLGSTPYPTMGAREVMRRVWDGYRLERPSHCRAELFRVISKCWSSDPSKRPDFALLRCEIGGLIEASQDGGGYVDLESFAESNKYNRSDDQSSHPYHHNHQSTSAVGRIAGEVDTVHM